MNTWIARHFRKLRAEQDADESEIEEPEAEIIHL